VSGIVLLLSRDFSRLIIISFVIVVPLAWYAMNQWLADFAYKVDVSPLIFIAAGVVVMTIAFISIFYQSLKAAMVSPSETLRSE
jgi:putative ABC transport system permease protein